MTFHLAVKDALFDELTVEVDEQTLAQQRCCKWLQCTGIQHTFCFLQCQSIHIILHTCTNVHASLYKISVCEYE